MSHATPKIGLAIAQAVSRRLPTAAVRVLAQYRSCWICGGGSGTGAASGAGAIGQLVTDVASAISLPPPPKNV